MIREVEDAHRVVREGTDDLQEIRKMIRTTKNNINTHITTVDNLKTQLKTIQEYAVESMNQKEGGGLGRIKGMRNV